MKRQALIIIESSINLYHRNRNETYLLNILYFCINILRIPAIFNLFLIPSSLVPVQSTLTTSSPPLISFSPLSEYFPFLYSGNSNNTTKGVAKYILLILCSRFTQYWDCRLLQYSGWCLKMVDEGGGGEKISLHLSINLKGVCT